MEIKHATAAELDAIMAIYASARDYMKESGNPCQWAGGYPQREIVEADLAAGNLYLCTEGEVLLGVFCYFVGEEPAYREIFEGAWLRPGTGGVMHRVAVATRGRGVASFCFGEAFARCKNLKIDTHRDNLPMQRSLEKNGFVRCGIIHLENGDERIAYQKI